jgi:hypothetical protein
MFSNRIVASSGFAFLLTALAGCGGSGGSDAPGTGPTATNQTTVGQITGFGSIYVNGIEFDTAGASYEVDDAIASNDDALGRCRRSDANGRYRHQDLRGHGRNSRCRSK